MIDLKLAQKEPEILAHALKKRHSGIDAGEFLELDKKRRSILAEVEELKSQRNKASAEIALMKREGRGEAAAELFRELGKLSDRIRSLDMQAQEAKDAVEKWLYAIPNLPDVTVPEGADENGNVEILRKGTPRSFDFAVKDHAELGSSLGGLDFERASRLAGSRFVVELDWAARLDRALINFFLDHHHAAGYVEVIPPYMVNRQAMTGTGQLPKFEEDLFRIGDWDFFLVPTAEVPLTNLHAHEILPEESLPLGYCAATPCFRSEAGAAGKDTRGLIRMHQFTKVEMVRFAHPEDSMNQLEKMTENACLILEKLELPYRVISLCGGDLGFSAAKTYDIEVWLPSQNTYREISSCSNCGDFQARRANIKFRPKGGKASFVHTLNGSGLPTGRTMAALIENGQQKDGSIIIPKSLRPYFGGIEVIEAPKK